MNASRSLFPIHNVYQQKAQNRAREMLEDSHQQWDGKRDEWRQSKSEARRPWHICNEMLPAFNNFSKSSIRAFSALLDICRSISGAWSTKAMNNREAYAIFGWRHGFCCANSTIDWQQVSMLCRFAEDPKTNKCESEELRHSVNLLCLLFQPITVNTSRVLLCCCL